MIVRTIFCEDATKPLSAESMDGERWQMRAKQAGLSQRVLARLLGHTELTVSRQLRGFYRGGEVTQHVVAAIIAWEIMTPEQREEWLRRVDEQA